MGKEWTWLVKIIGTYWKPLDYEISTKSWLIRQTIELNRIFTWFHNISGQIQTSLSRSTAEAGRNPFSPVKDLPNFGILWSSVCCTWDGDGLGEEMLSCSGWIFWGNCGWMVWDGLVLPLQAFFESVKRYDICEPDITTVFFCTVFKDWPWRFPIIAHRSLCRWNWTIFSDPATNDLVESCWVFCCFWYPH